MFFYLFEYIKFVCRKVCKRFAIHLKGLQLLSACLRVWINLAMVLAKLLKSCKPFYINANLLQTLVKTNKNITIKLINTCKGVNFERKQRKTF